MHYIRCVATATSKLNTHFRRCIRPAMPDRTSWTNLILQTNTIRFRRRRTVEFNCLKTSCVHVELPSHVQTFSIYSVISHERFAVN